MAQRPDIETLRLPLAKGGYRTKLYRGERQAGMLSDFEDVIVLAPGLLGSGTLHFAASALARRGHDVAVVSHDRTSLLHPNKDRSQHVHFTARAASQATGKRGVILIGHSNGNQDVHHAATEAIKRQTEQPDDSKLYQVRAIGSLAGAGLSGRRIYGQELYRETVGLVHELWDHPVEELDVVARSAANFVRHPVLAFVESVGAMHCDVRANASGVINAVPIRAYVETYLESDGVIPRPEDRHDYELRPGSHLTPVVCGDTITAVAEELYETNEPHGLQIANFGRIAA